MTNTAKQKRLLYIEKEVIYINTKLLKTIFKKIIVAFFNVLTFILVFAGFFWIFGTTGALECDIITISQTIIQLLTGIIIFGVAWVSNFIKTVIE